MDPLRTEISGGIAVLTLNRPDKLNAINYAMADAIETALSAIEADPGIKVVILTGTGEKAFSAGADIHEFSQSVHLGPDAAVREFVRRGQAMTSRIEFFPKPIIAAVNGLAFGGGCEIVEAAHLSVASDHALFAKPEIALGMLPTFGGTQRLARLAGRKRALELLLTGDRFSASKASEIGLVNRVVPPQDLIPAAEELARRITRHASGAVAGIIAAVTRGINLTVAEGLHIESDQFARLVSTRDLAEGLSAWRERREPVYAGH